MWGTARPPGAFLANRLPDILPAEMIRRNSFTGGMAMPGQKHLRGVGPKEQRQYEHIKESTEQSGRYGGRAEEVAARTVMKEHKEKGHKKGE
jgi:hypothetical protein